MIEVFSLIVSVLLWWLNIVVQFFTSAGALGIFVAVFFIGVVLRLLVRPFIGGAWQDRQDHSDGGG